MIVTAKCLYNLQNLFYFSALFVTQFDKRQLIDQKYKCSLNSVYLHFCVSYNNSANISVN